MIYKNDSPEKIFLLGQEEMLKKLIKRFSESIDRGVIPDFSEILEKALDELYEEMNKFQ